MANCSFRIRLHGKSTNATGALVEKRQFDPGCYCKKYKMGAGTNLTKLTFFDRGYTGHEHLESVGLANMNGRVYDPVLHHGFTSR